MNIWLSEGIDASNDSSDCSIGKVRPAVSYDKQDGLTATAKVVGVTV